MTTFHSKIDECSLLVDLEPESLQTDGAHPFDGSDEERSPGMPNYVVGKATS